MGELQLRHGPCHLKKGFAVAAKLPKTKPLSSNREERIVVHNLYSITMNLESARLTSRR